MATCPDCTYVDEQVKGNGKYDVIDIGTHVKYMKEFLRLRDAIRRLTQPNARERWEYPASCSKTER